MVVPPSPFKNVNPACGASVHKWDGSLFRQHYSPTGPKTRQERSDSKSDNSTNTVPIKQQCECDISRLRYTVLVAISARAGYHLH